jgi:hypothetical protein
MSHVAPEGERSDMTSEGNDIATTPLPLAKAKNASQKSISGGGKKLKKNPKILGLPILLQISKPAIEKRRLPNGKRYVLCKQRI